MTFEERNTYMDQLSLSLRGNLRIRGSFKEKGNVFVYSGNRKAVNVSEQIPVNYLYSKIWYGLIVSWQLVELNAGKVATLLPFVSLPFFASVKSGDDRMMPVFRAEWDSYPQNGTVHPQAHWHFTQTQSVYDVLSPDYDAVSEEWNTLLLDDYQRLLSELPLNLMHFAMSERWAKGGDMVATTPGPNELALWISKLLHHVETEIRYVMDE